MTGLSSNPVEKPMQTQRHDKLSGVLLQATPSELVLKEQEYSKTIQERATVTRFPY